MADSIVITTDTTSFEVRPGSSAEANLTIQNLEAVVGVFSVEVDGLDPSWYRLSGTSASLFPGDKTSTTLTVSPPRDSSALAQTYSFSVKVTSQKDEAHQAVLPLSVRILPFYDFTLDLRPQRSAGKVGSHTLSILNTGNAGMSFTIAGRDPEGKCKFGFSPDLPYATPGRPMDVSVTLRGKRPLKGQPKSYSFTLTAAPANSVAEAETVPGFFDTPPWIPRWAVRAVSISLIVVAIAVAFWVSPLKDLVFPPPTPVARLEITPSNFALNEGEVTQIAVIARDAEGSPIERFDVKRVSWTSDDPSILQVLSQQDGSVQGLVSGSALITARLVDQDLSEPPSAKVTVLPTLISTDCIRYNPEDVRFGVSDGRLTLKSGETIIMFLEEDDDQGNMQSLVRRHTTRCFIGRDSPSLVAPDYEIEFWVGNSAVLSPIEPVDCDAYSPSSLQIRAQEDSSWLLTDGVALQVRLDDQQDAQSALLLATRHTQRCFIDRRPNGGTETQFLAQYWE